MSSLGDYATTAEFHDLIRDIVKREIDIQRKARRYAVVQSIDTATRSCQVIFNGDTTTVKVFYGSIQPAAAGQIVCIEGAGSDQYIADVLGYSAFDMVYYNWTAPTLQTAGYTTDSFDPLMYRVIGDHGNKKVQLRGKLVISGTPAGLLFTMPSDVRPPINLSPILIARSFGEGSHVAIIDVKADGTINLAGATVGIRGVNNVTQDTGDAGQNATTVTDTNHKHRSSDFASGTANPQNLVFTAHWTDYITSGSISHSHTGALHHHSMNHGHTNIQVGFPTFISFNGVEYFP